MLRILLFCSELILFDLLLLLKPLSMIYMVLMLLLIEMDSFFLIYIHLCTYFLWTNSYFLEVSCSILTLLTIFDIQYWLSYSFLNHCFSQLISLNLEGFWFSQPQEMFFSFLRPYHLSSETVLKESMIQKIWQVLLEFLKNWGRKKNFGPKKEYTFEQEYRNGQVWKKRWSYDYESSHSILAVKNCQDVPLTQISELIRLLQESTTKLLQIPFHKFLFYPDHWRYFHQKKVHRLSCFF